MKKPDSKHIIIPTKVGGAILPLFNALNSLTRNWLEKPARLLGFELAPSRAKPVEITPDHPKREPDVANLKDKLADWAKATELANKVIDPLKIEPGIVTSKDPANKANRGR